jgi:hypothetical protein
MNKHESLVREIAEEMAKASARKGWNLIEAEKNRRIADYVPAARIAVKRMADAFTVGYYLPGMDGETDSCKEMLISRGLIPDENQPEGTGI